jgi:hypothetical protein
MVREKPPTKSSNERRYDNGDAEPPPQAFASEQGNARHGEGGRDNAQKNAATEERQPRKTTLEGKIMPDDVCHGAPLQLTRQLYLQRA